MVAALYPHRPGAGEVSSIALIHDLDIVEQPRSGTAVLLSELPGKLRDMGYTRWDDAGDYLENSYIAYELEPVKDPEPTGVWMWGRFNRLPVLIKRLYESGERNHGRLPQRRHCGRLPAVIHWMDLPGKDGRRKF